MQGMGAASKERGLMPSKLPTNTPMVETARKRKTSTKRTRSQCLLSIAFLLNIKTSHTCDTGSHEVKNYGSNDGSDACFT